MSFLDNVKMAFECPLAWEKLTGDGAVRHCDQCEKSVTDLSSMSRREAGQWLAENGDAKVCVRMVVDAKGRSKHKKPSIVPKLAPLLPTTVLLSVASGDGCVSTELGCDRELMGDVAVEQIVEPIQIEDTGIMLLGEPAYEPPVTKMGRIAIEHDATPEADPNE